MREKNEILASIPGYVVIFFHAPVPPGGGYDECEPSYCAEVLL
jgi:hypothetical protein